MPHPVGVAYFFVSVMFAVATYSMGRLLLARQLGRRNHYDVNVAHVVMAVAMIGMLVPRWNVISSGPGEVVFGAMAIYFLAVTVGVALRRGPWGDDDLAHPTYHPLVHLLMACAMLDMYGLGMAQSRTSGAAMAMAQGSSSAGGPGLTLFLVALLIVAAVWLLDEISAPALSPQLAGSSVANREGERVVVTSERPWLAPRLEISCHVAMCVTMAYMLVLVV